MEHTHLQLCNEFCYKLKYILYMDGGYTKGSLTFSWCHILTFKWLYDN